jgi:hypothetical protein
MALSLFLVPYCQLLDDLGYGAGAYGVAAFADGEAQALLEGYWGNQ